MTLPPTTNLLMLGGSARQRKDVEVAAAAEGCDLLLADDLDGALSALDRLTPHLLLVMADGEADLDQLARLRATPEGKRIPVLVALAAPLSPDHAHGAGADLVVPGPIAPGALLAVGTGLLRLARDQASWQQRAEEFACLAEIVTLLYERSEPEEVLTVVASRIASTQPLSSCSVFILGIDRTTAHLATGAAGFDRGGPTAPLDLSRFPDLEAVARDGRHLLLDDVTHDPFELTVSQDDESLEMGGHRSSALFPILHGGEVQGVLSLHLPALAPRIDPERIPFFERAAAACAGPIAAIRQRLADAQAPSTESTETSLEEHDLLVNLVEHSPNAIVAADMEGTILVFNRSAERLFGTRREDMVGRFDISDLFLPGAGPELVRILVSSELGEPGYVHNLQTEALAADGEIIPVSVSAAHLTEKDTPVALMGIIEDLRQRLALESRLQEMSAQLVESEKQATLAVLAGTTAHELNQPLTTIMGLVELLMLRTGSDEQLTGQLDKVYQETERMSAIVRRIGRITRFSTTSYVGGTEILDLDKSSE